MLWLKDENNREAPSFWHGEVSSENFDLSDQDQDNSDTDQSLENDMENGDQDQKRKIQIENFADSLISTSVDDIFCTKHTSAQDISDNCTDCELIKGKVRKYQKHNHTFTCAKKKKHLTIKANEGHGICDGQMIGPELRDMPIAYMQV